MVKKTFFHTDEIYSKFDDFILLSALKTKFSCGEFVKKIQTKFKRVKTLQNSPQSVSFLKSPPCNTLWLISQR